MSTITFDAVSKIYDDDVHAVDDISLQITEGERFALVGPSGSGKTSLLRMLAGLEQIDAGTIKIDDQVVNRVPARERGVAMVFQDYALYPHMSVAANIGYPLRLARKPAQQAREKIQDMADLFGIGDLLDRRPHQLSGGQQQRAALARALVRDPKVLLLDEPLSNCEPALRADLRRELRSLQQRIGTTTILVTHDQEDALAFADRIALLQDGQLQQVAEPDTIYCKPISRFVASFFGRPSMNLLPATVLDDEPGSLSINGDHTVSIASLGSSLQPLSGRPVILGIRPEHLSFAEGGLPAQIDLIESCGDSRLAYCHSCGCNLIARVGNDCHVHQGDTVLLRMEPGQVHCFSADSGIRIDAD